MKKHLPLFIATAAGLAVAPVMAAPTQEELTGSYWVGGIVDYFKADDSDDEGELGDGTGLGLNFGHRFSESWGGRVRYEYLDINRHDGEVSKHGAAYGFDALYFPTPEAYFAIGPRRVDLIKDRTALNLGMGYSFFLGRNWSITPEVNWMAGAYTNLSAGIGLNYHFGLSEPVKAAEPAPVVAAPVVVEAPKDSDGDGVYDDKDQCPGTPKGDKVDENGCTIFAEQVRTIRLNVLFANDSSAIPEDSYSDIAQVADFMKRYPHVDVVIEGHTSAPGSDSYNMKLSEARAQAVATALTTRYQIASERVKAVGYGETRLLDKANSAEAHKVNRRVVAVISVSERYRLKK